MKRAFAVLSTNRECDGNVASTLSMLKAVPDSEITVFSRGGSYEGFGSVAVPEELDSEPKLRNWINERYRSAGFSGFLHVVSDMTEVVKDPSQFVADIERMMDVFDYGLWLNTACDPLNYVYAKYTPNLTLDVNLPEVAEKTGISGKIHVASHSNTQWVIYDYSKLAGSDLLRFDEDFTVAMFYIVELLSRRRNTAGKGSLYMMNQYLTVGSEPGTFRNAKIKLQNNDTEEVMKRENELWNGKKINFRPDYNTDRLLELFWEKLAAKAGIDPAA